MKDLKEFKKKVKSLAIVCLWFLGTVGGIGFAIYGGSWPCAIGCGINGAIAWSTVKKNLDYLKS